MSSLVLFSCFGAVAFSCSKELCRLREVDHESGVLHLLPKLLFPRSALIDPLLENTICVGGKLNALLVQDDNLAPAELGPEVAKLEDDVLSRAPWALFC